MVFAVLAGSFSIGAFVGYRKARFAFAWGENYQRNFAGPRGGFAGDFMRDVTGKDLIEGHGVAGEIVKVDASASSSQTILLVRGRNNVERSILVNDQTTLRRLGDTMHADAQQTPLSPGDFIVVLGEPNDSGQIVAKFIRSMPTPMPIEGEMPMRNIGR